MAEIDRSTPNSYRAFLIRMWKDEQTNDWRVQLEDPGTRQKHGFRSLKEFFSYLAADEDPHE
jgi:hypothetical protein